jgi:hypothetical protein
MTVLLFSKESKLWIPPWVFFCLISNSIVSSRNILFILANSQIIYSILDVEINFTQAYYNTNVRINISIHSQSKKKPNIWNSTPVSRRRTLMTVVLCSGDFKFYFHTSHKFATGPSRHPAKHVPGRVKKKKKALGAVYQQ